MDPATAAEADDSRQREPAPATPADEQRREPAPTPADDEQREPEAAPGDVEEPAEDDDEPRPVRPRRRGPRKLSPHRMTLALALVSTAPPLVMRYGWPGVLAALAAVAYAVYLVGGKKWPWSR